MVRASDLLERRRAAWSAQAARHEIADLAVQFVHGRASREELEEAVRQLDGIMNSGPGQS